MIGVEIGPAGIFRAGASPSKKAVPKMKKSSPPQRAATSVVIGASMPLSMVTQLRGLAAASGRSFSAELRQAIRPYLEAQNKMSPATVPTAPGSKIAEQRDHVGP